MRAKELFRLLIVGTFSDFLGIYNYFYYIAFCFSDVFYYYTMLFFYSFSGLFEGRLIFLFVFVLVLVISLLFRINAL